MKYRVTELACYNQLYGVTSLFVNQRSADISDRHVAVGCIELAHNLAGVILVDCERIYDQGKQMDFEGKRARVRIDITPDGLIKPLEAIPKQLEQRQP